MFITVFTKVQITPVHALPICLNKFLSLHEPACSSPCSQRPRSLHYVSISSISMLSPAQPSPEHVTGTVQKVTSSLDTPRRCMEGEELYLQSFLMSTLERGGRSASSPGRFTRYPLLCTVPNAQCGGLQ